MLKRIIVAAGLIRAPLGHPHEGDLLVSRRSKGVHLAGSWEFPGGKVEGGEAPVSALRRELREELGVEISHPMIYAVGHHIYLDAQKEVILMVYECLWQSGAPRALEVAEFAWLSPSAVCELPLPPADLDVVLRLNRELSSPFNLETTWRFLEDREETFEVGKALGALLIREPTLPRNLAAIGELGAGKTSLAQGIARGLGVPPDIYVNSPTFALHQSHQGDVSFHHLDLYRLMDEDELIHLGFEELLDQGVSYIEWPQRAPRLLEMTPHLKIKLYYLDEVPTSIRSQLTPTQLSSEGRVLCVEGSALQIASLRHHEGWKLTKALDESI